MTDSEKLREAKEKLACKIEPPKPASSCSVTIPADEVRLTQMTTAGG